MRRTGVEVLAIGNLNVAAIARIGVAVENPHVGRRCFVHSGRRREWGTALPELDEAGVTGGCHRARTVVGANEERVGVHPGYTLLRRWQSEPILHELPSGE